MENFPVSTPTYSGNHKGLPESLPVLLTLHAHTRVSRVAPITYASGTRIFCPADTAPSDKELAETMASTTARTSRPSATECAIDQIESPLPTVKTTKLVDAETGLLEATSPAPALKAKPASKTTARESTTRKRASRPRRFKPDGMVVALKVLKLAAYVLMVFTPAAR